MSSIHLSFEGRVAWLVFDCPGEKVNRLSSDVMMALSSHLAEIEGRKELDGLIVASAKEGVFLTGADIHEIASVTDPAEAVRACRMGQAIFSRMQKLPFPAVALIDGVCLGGGTELALACHGRLGSDHPKFQMGLPEVTLGIIPAWGGTTRLPRLVGLRQALDLILTGRAVDARKAEGIGLIDHAVPRNDLKKHALELIGVIRRRGPTEGGDRPGGWKRWLIEGNPLARSIVLRQARKAVLARTRGHYAAPLEAIAVIRKSWGLPIDKALEIEAKTAGALIVSAVSKNLIHLFFLSEKARKDPGVEGATEPTGEVRRTGLLGAGTMGGGIAWLLSHRDIRVRVKDVRPEALGSGLREAHRLHERRRKRRELSAWELQKRMSLISPTLDWSGFRQVDVLVEAIVEDLETKKRVLREAESFVSPECWIGSNTSTLPITELQSALEHPERMAGFHFFNPVERMPLIEVIRGKATSDLTVAAFVSLAKRLGKTPVLVHDGPGFLVNRILGPYLNEACHILLETGDLKGIDRALLDFGMPMGPLRLLDEVGVDVAAKAAKVLAAAYGERIAPTSVFDQLVAAGRLGKKTGKGFCLHRKGISEPDPDVLPLLGIEKVRSAGREEVVERSVYLMVAEAARCLEERVVRTAGELDLAMVMGIGFPPFRGGLLRYAETEGLSRIVEGLLRWQGRLGLRFDPPEPLLNRARSGHGFYDRVARGT